MTHRVTSPDQLGLGLGELASPPEEDFDRERGFRCEGCGLAEAKELRIARRDPKQRHQLPAILLCDWCLTRHRAGELELSA